MSKLQIKNSSFEDHKFRWILGIFENLKDFVSRLLIKDPKERLASERIKKEIFFMDINWENLEAGNERTPINPKVLLEFIN